MYAVIQYTRDASVKKLPNRRRVELTLQQEKSDKTVKGKQGKRRAISLNTESLPQGAQSVYLWISRY